MHRGLLSCADFCKTSYVLKYGLQLPQSQSCSSLWISRLASRRQYIVCATPTEETLLEKGFSPSSAAAMVKEELQLVTIEVMHLLAMKNCETRLLERKVQELELQMQQIGHFLELLNMKNMRAQSRVNMRGLMEHIEDVFGQYTFVLQMSQMQGKHPGKNLREELWREILESFPSLQKCIVEQTNWDEESVAHRLNHMYSILHFLYDPMMRAIREDEVLLYTGPLKTDEVDALECIAKTFKIEYVRKDLTQQMVEAASKDQLKYMCRFRKLQVSGTKKDLIARLVPFTIAIET